MKWMTDINIPAPAEHIQYGERLFLIGSCFTEHIGGRLADHQFLTCQNPHGILFNPLSVCNSLQSYLTPKVYQPTDLIYLNELWLSWHHHSHFSGMDQQQVLDTINRSQQNAHHFLKQARWMIVTLGSSYSYQLVGTGQPVANCHRGPAQMFNKLLLPVQQVIENLQSIIGQLQVFNPTIKVIFTISPVRHLRDGVVNNNRSKARLIEAVHEIIATFNHCYYFPAYELVVDVLRDYRFYDVDLAHPNYAATEFVFEKFCDTFMDAATRKAMQEVRKLINAYRHKPFQPGTVAHQKFLQQSLLKTRQLQHQLPQIDLGELDRYFSHVAK